MSQPSARDRYRAQSGNVFKQQMNQIAADAGGDEGAGYDRLFAQRNVDVTAQYQQDMLNRQEQARRYNELAMQKMALNNKKDSSIQEIMKDMIYEPDNRIVDDSGFKYQITNPSDLVKSLTHINDFGVSDRYFYLNSSNTTLSEFTLDGKLVFYLNKIANLSPIENIIEMEITPFYMEKFPTGDERLLPLFTADASSAIHAPVEVLTKNLYSRTVSILIEEVNCAIDNSK
jgi:hypothetical protein